MQLMTNSTRKRPHEKPSVDIRLIVFIINRSILRTIQDTRIFHKKTDDNGPCAKFIEFAPNEIFRSDESNISSFFLYYLKHETLNHTDGLSINGQLRGMSTRILINVSVWKSFKIPDLAQHYSRFGNERVAKLVPVMTSEVEVCAVIERYETATLKRILSQKNSHSKMCSHITKLYELIEESKQVILIAKKEKSDMMDSISSFETEIRQLRREIEGWKHKSSGNKSVITKELNWLALETVYRNQEWVRCQGILTI